MRRKQNASLAYNLVYSANRRALDLLCNLEIRKKMEINQSNDLIFVKRGKRTDADLFVAGYSTMVKHAQKSGLGDAAEELMVFLVYYL